MGLQPLGSCSARSQQLTAHQRPLILLLVEDRSVVERLALCGGPARGDGAAFAISRNHNLTRARDSSVIPNGQPQCAVVDLFVRPRV